MTFTAGIVGSIGGGGATSTSTGPHPDPEANPGVQLLDNSKLQGPTSTDATNWTNRYPGEGTITFSASAVADHRKV